LGYFAVVVFRLLLSYSEVYVRNAPLHRDVHHKAAAGFPLAEPADECYGNGLVFGEGLLQWLG
jgi:hypothetical protein